MEFIDYKKASQVLGIPMGTLYSWVSKKHVPHHRFGPRLVRFEVAELDKWVVSHRVSIGSSEDGRT